MDTRQAMQAALEQARSLLDDFSKDPKAVDFLESLAEKLVGVFENKGKVFIAGNGGSHADSLHFAEEFTGRYRKDRRALPVMALGEATHQSCVGNDFGFEEIFARQVQAFAKSEDLLIVLSTSGNSTNLIRAVEEAKKVQCATVALLGRGGGKLLDQVDLKIVVPGPTADRIQELHMMLLHMVIEAVERRMFPEHYS